MTSRWWLRHGCASGRFRAVMLLAVAHKVHHSSMSPLFQVFTFDVFIFPCLHHGAKRRGQRRLVEHAQLLVSAPASRSPRRRTAPTKPARAAAPAAARGTTSCRVA